MTQEEIARDIAEYILFTQARDVESLTVWEITSDQVYEMDDSIREVYEDRERYEELCDEVLEQIDTATVGISWDGGRTWQW